MVQESLTFHTNTILVSFTTNLKQQSMSLSYTLEDTIFYLSKDASYFIQGLNKPVKVWTSPTVSWLSSNHSVSKDGSSFIFRCWKGRGQAPEETGRPYKTSWFVNNNQLVMDKVQNKEISNTTAVKHLKNR